MSEAVKSRLSSIMTRLRTFFSRAEVTNSAKMAIAASASFIVGQAVGDIIQHPSTLISGLWSVMASIVVMQSRLGGTYKAVWTRFLGILIGSLAGGVFIDFFGDGPTSIFLGVFITVSLCAVIGLRDSVRIAGLSTALIIILGGAKPDINPWTFTMFRFLDSCVGMVVSLSVAYFLWPEKAIVNMRQTTVRILGLIAKFYRLSTALEYKNDDLEVAVKGLHADIIGLLEENRTYCVESEIELFDRDHLHENWKFFVDQMETLFEMIVTLGKVNHDSLNLIIDDDLAVSINKVIDDTDKSLVNLEKSLTSLSLQGQQHSLVDSLKRLNDELIRFRLTRTTRKFSLEDVEGFFVYFYSLKAIGDEVVKMEATAKNM